MYIVYYLLVEKKADSGAGAGFEPSFVSGFVCGLSSEN